MILKNDPKRVKKISNETNLVTSDLIMIRKIQWYNYNGCDGRKFQNFGTAKLPKSLNLHHQNDR